MTSHNDRSRIDNLLSGGKITESDHQILVEALEKKSSFIKRLADFLINPFPLLSIPVGILVGALSILILALLGAKLVIYYPGALDFQVIQDGQRVYTTGELLVQNVVAILVLSLAFFAVALISRQRNLRFVDFLSSTLFTRVPYAIFILALAVLSSVFPGLLPRHEGPPTAAAIVLAVMGISFLVWILTTMFFAFKESSGLRSKKLWIGFIASLILAEAISYTLDAWILK